MCIIWFIHIIHIIYQSLRNAVTSSSLVAFPNYPNYTNTRRARRAPDQTLWNTVWEGYAVLFPLHYSVMNTTDCIAPQVATHRPHNETRNNPKERPFIVESLMAFPFYLNDINARSPWRAPEQTLWNTVWEGVCHGLPFILFSYERHRLS